jgi:hypothetical protein
MKGLGQLNTHGNVAVVVDSDSRKATIVLDRKLVNNIVDDVVFHATLGVPNKRFTRDDYPVNIDEIINFDRSLPKLSATILPPSVIANTPTLDWVTEAANDLNLEISEDQSYYEISAFQNDDDWDKVSFTFNFPSNYMNLPLWYVKFNLEWYDENTKRNQTLTWNLYDPDYYYLALLPVRFNFTPHGSKLKISSANLVSGFDLWGRRYLSSRLLSKFNQFAGGSKLYNLSSDLDINYFTQTLLASRQPNLRSSSNLSTKIYQTLMASRQPRVRASSNLLSRYYYTLLASRQPNTRTVSNLPISYFTQTLLASRQPRLRSSSNLLIGFVETTTTNTSRLRTPPARLASAFTWYNKAIYTARPKPSLQSKFNIYNRINKTARTKSSIIASSTVNVKHTGQFYYDIRNITISGTITDVDCNDSLIFVLVDNTVKVYDQSGNLKTTIASDSVYTYKTIISNYSSANSPNALYIKCVSPSDNSVWVVMKFITTNGGNSFTRSNVYPLSGLNYFDSDRQGAIAFTTDYNKITIISDNSSFSVTTLYAIKALSLVYSRLHLITGSVPNFYHTIYNRVYNPNQNWTLTSNTRMNLPNWYLPYTNSSLGHPTGGLYSSYDNIYSIVPGSFKNETSTEYQSQLNVYDPRYTTSTLPNTMLTVIDYATNKMIVNGDTDILTNLNYSLVNASEGNDQFIWYDDKLLLAYNLTDNPKIFGGTGSDLFVYAYSNGVRFFKLR